MHNHSHHSHHDHHRSSDGGSERALLGALILNAGFLVIEAGVGWWTQSLALLSDAAHMVSDVMALSVALFATRLAARGATSSQTFGLRRAEPVGAFVNALGLILACLFIFSEATERLLGDPPHIAGWPVFIVGGVGLAINLGSAWALARGDSDNLNIRGALLHMLADALGSAGAMIAAVAMLYGYAWADAAVSLLIGVLVLYSSIGLLRDSGRVLLEMTPKGTDVDAIAAALRGIHGVTDAHDLHIWTLDGQYTLLTAHIVVAEGCSTEPVRVVAEAMLKDRFGIEHQTLQLERDTCCPPDAPCAAVDKPAGSG